MNKESLCSTFRNLCICSIF